MLKLPRVYPVIHAISRSLTVKQAKLAHACGADGVFIISHTGDEELVRESAQDIKQGIPLFQVGINLLTMSPVAAIGEAEAAGLDMCWSDNMGVSSAGLSDIGLACQDTVKAVELFASVAFKYQAAELDPNAAAFQARKAGFIPTTSGEKTGKAPSVEKIKGMFEAAGGTLAIASGITPENVTEYAPYLSHILVATGIGTDFHHINLIKLTQLLKNLGRD